MKYNELTEEQKAKLRDCQSSEDLIKLAAAEGVELTDEQLEAVSGGAGWGCTDDVPAETCDVYTGRNNM